MKAIAIDDDVLQDIIESEDWMEMSAEAFSFQIFGSIRFDDDIQQNILELDSANKRLNLLLQLLQLLNSN